MEHEEQERHEEREKQEEQEQHEEQDKQERQEKLKPYADAILRAGRWTDLEKLPKLTETEITFTDPLVSMFICVFYGYSDLLKTFPKNLLSNVIGEDKDNLYMFAAYCGHLDIMLYLEENNIDINHCTYSQCCDDLCDAYLYAEFAQHHDIMNYLKNNPNYKREIPTNYRNDV